MSITGLLIGAIALALLDAFLSNRAASTNVGGAETGIASLLAKFIDPAVPAFSSSASSSTSSTASSATTTTTASPLTPTTPSTTPVPSGQR